MNNNPTITPQVVNSPFKNFCMSVGAIPTSYQDSLDYYENLLWLIKFLDETVIPAVSTNGNAVAELQGFYLQLQSYVNNYFDNLDVQEEINNKLDDMVEQGTLQEIIADYLNSKAIFGFDNVASMKLSTNLIDGSYARTLGYNSLNDGGGSLYKIREVTNSDVVDEMTIIAIGEDNLVGELIYSDVIMPEQLGAYGDGIHDDTLKLQKCLNIEKNIELKAEASYLITSDLNLPEYVSIEGNNATIKYQYNGNREHQIRNSNWLANDNYTNYLYLNNINFYVDTTSRHIKLIGLTNYDSVIIKNCNYSNNLSITQGTWFIDMYSNNRNILIDNINVITKSNTTTSLNTCLGLRQYSLTGKTYNANILNSNFIHNGRDETLWIDGWFGELSSVNLINNKIIDESTSDATMCWFGLGTEGGSSPQENVLMNNITIDNCYFEKSKMDYAALKLGYITSDYVNSNKINDFIFKNNYVKILDGSGSILTTVGNSVSFENNTFEYNGSLDFQYGYILFGQADFNSCKFIINATTTNNSVTFRGNNITLNNCNLLINNGNIFNGGYRYLKNCKINGGISLLYISSDSSVDFTIEECDIKTTGDLFQRFNITSDQLIKIINSNIKCGEYVFNDWSITGNKDIRIVNTNFDNDTLKICNSSVDVISISNCTKKGKVLVGIPTTANDRGSCVVGTVFDGGAGHSVARKISDGNETSNWEII